MFDFEGTVRSRSISKRGLGPPAEAAILPLNPERRERIIEATGWPDVFPGSLNVEIREDASHRILSCAPVIREKGETTVRL